MARRSPTRYLLAVAVVCALVAGCAREAPRRFASTDTSVQVTEGLDYWTGDGGPLAADVCAAPLASGAPARGAVLIVHGGGFTDGSRSDPGVRSLCKSVAEQGLVGVAVDYRKAPDFIYPAQVDDLANAVTWVRQPAQAQRFGVDPTRVALIGSSAGALIAQQLAVRGEGPVDAGTRVSAVVSLSGLSTIDSSGLDLGAPPPEAFQVVLRYLGCPSVQDCPQATAASPTSQVDASDPPMLLVNGTAEIVPVQQAQAMSAALDAVGVENQVVLVDGQDHGLPLLTADVRRTVKTFLGRFL